MAGLKKQTEGAHSPARVMFDGLQVIRGIAAFMVVFHHSCWVINQYHPSRSVLAGQKGLAEVGAGGVDIFFCISGVVIAHAASSTPVGFQGALKFGARRVLRVLPPYWFFTLVLIVMWSAGIALKDRIITYGVMISSFFLVPYPQRTIEGQVSYHPILDVGWTLTFEMYFYVICAVVIAFFGGNRIWPWSLIVLTAIAAVSFGVGVSPIARGVLLSPMLFEFTAGVLLARFLAGRVDSRAGWALVFVAIIAFSITATIRDAMSMRVLWWGVPGVLLVAGSLMIPVNTTSRLNRILLFFGTASYSVYLVHPFVVMLAGNILKRGFLANVNPDVLLILLTMAATLGAATTYPLVEKPLVQLLRPKVPIKRVAQ